MMKWTTKFSTVLGCALAAVFLFTSTMEVGAVPLTSSPSGTTTTTTTDSNSDAAEDGNADAAAEDNAAEAAVDTTAAAGTVTSATVTSSSVNIRSEASTSASVAGKATSGQELTVTGETQGSDGKTWYAVTFDNVSGYIRSDLVEAHVSDATAEPTVDESQETEEPEEEPIVDNSADYSVAFEDDGNGSSAWYLHDNTMGTRYQVSDLLNAEETNKNNQATIDQTAKSMRFVVILMAVVIVVLIIVVTILVIKIRSAYEYYEDYDDEDDDDSPVPAKGGQGGDQVLLSMLKDLRRSEAKKLHLQPWVIFSDVSLDDMSIMYPETLDELIKCQSVGEGKARKYGKPFIELITRYVEENEISRPDDFVVRSMPNKSSDKIFIITSIDRRMDLEDIADARNMDMNELLSAMEDIVEFGTRLNLDYYIDQNIDADVVDEIYEYFKDEAESGSLEDAIQALGGDYEEMEIRLVRLKFMSEVAN